MSTATAQGRLTARFASTCKRCRQPINVGDVLDNIGTRTKKVWVHYQCPTQRESYTNPAEPESKESTAFETAVEKSNKRNGVSTPKSKKEPNGNRHCQRCHKMINKGDRIISWTPELGGPTMNRGNGKTYHWWVHENCEAAHKVEVPVSSEAGEAPKLEGSQAEQLAQFVNATVTQALQQFGNELNFEQVEAEINSQIDAQVTSGIKDESERTDDKIATAFSRVIESTENVAEITAKRLIDEAIQPRTIEIKDPSGEVRELKGHRHQKFEEVLELAMYREEIFLPGPTGSGKTHLASQIAEALGLKFGFVSCSAGMSEGQLNGRMLPVGAQGQFEYVISKFVKCYEEGGVFLLDEIDAADENVLLAINAALANGFMAVPNRPEKPEATRHADFVCIAAANTYGRGSDRLYVGRNQLDESTLDRFKFGTVEMEYDTALERQLCPDTELLERMHKYRDGIFRNRLERVVSTRTIMKAYTWKHRGWDDEKIDAKVFGGWSDDEVQKVK